MKRTILLPLALLAVMPSVVHAQLASTGDLGNSVIWGHSGGYFSVSLDTPDALTTGTAALAIKSGLWNGGTLFVEEKINGTSLGTFDVGSGYIDPGPTYTNFDVSGPIVAGTSSRALIWPRTRSSASGPELRSRPRARFNSDAGNRRRGSDGSTTTQVVDRRK